MTPVPLCPTQQRAFEGVVGALRRDRVVVLSGDPGCGRTTVLEAIQVATGAGVVRARDLVAAMDERHPMAIEEAFVEVMDAALDEHETVLVDDFDALVGVTAGSCHFYPRSGYLSLPLVAILERAAELDRRVLFVSDGSTPDVLRRRAFMWHIDDFGVADYRAICAATLGADRAASIELERVHRFAPKLDAHSLRAACAWLRETGRCDADEFIRFLESQRVVSNVALSEVDEVELRDLKGVDDVIEALEANIVVPLENLKLAEELGLRPKRGVLLAGPPGTGKTTIGRALARRLKGKFFRIDGTFISGTHEFFSRVHAVFEAAKQNAPCIIFIDDSDVIFEGDDDTGLYRYLLTLLDGLESRSAAGVCVMLTAMNVGSLPPALVRSGRIELWLETRLPDDAARREILMESLIALPPDLCTADADQLAKATDGLSGADMKRLVGDGKLLYAHDIARGIAPRAANAYFLAAIETIRRNHERYEAAAGTGGAGASPRSADGAVRAMMMASMVRRAKRR